MTKIRGGEQTVRMRAVAAASREASPDPLPHGMTVTLEVTDGPMRGKVFHLGNRMTVVGREEGAIVIGDPLISRRHATLEVLDMETIILRDLSSTNGTYHDDRLIAFCKVADGDEIRLGSTTLIVGVERLG